MVNLCFELFFTKIDLLNENIALSLNLFLCWWTEYKMNIHIGLIRLHWNIVVILFYTWSSFYIMMTFTLNAPSPLKFWFCTWFISSKYQQSKLLEKKSLATLLICLFLEKCSEFCESSSVSLEKSMCNVFTFLKRYRFKAWHFSRVPWWVDRKHWQCCILSNLICDPPGSSRCHPPAQKGFYEWDIVGKVNMGLPQRWNLIYRINYVFQKYTKLTQFPNSFWEVYIFPLLLRVYQLLQEYKIVLPQYV